MISYIIVHDIVVPENIQTPNTEGISPRITVEFPFSTDDPPNPSGISTSVTKTPQPLWKSSFS